MQPHPYQQPQIPHQQHQPDPDDFNDLYGEGLRRRHKSMKYRRKSNRIKKYRKSRKPIRVR